METIRLYVLSYHGDFCKEREILYKEVLPDLRAWCESKHLNLHETDIRWGGCVGHQSISDILPDILDAYFKGIMPFFIVLTCDSLGLVPMWGEVPMDVVDDVQKRFQMTENEMDLLHAVYRVDNPNSFFLVRSDSFLDTISAEERRHFVGKNKIPSRLLDYCKSGLEKYPKTRVLHYSYDSVCLTAESKAVPVVEMDGSIFHKISTFVQQRIELDHPQAVTGCNLLDQTRDAHRAFMKSRSAKVKGRKEAVQQIQQYINLSEHDVPLLVLGGAGSGKSSIMANAADAIIQLSQTDQLACPERGAWTVFYHFVGAIPGSTELAHMLRRLILELDIVSESSLPHELEGLAQMACSALSSEATKPVIVFVDAINQFDEEPAAQIMSWIPRKLAPQVRCVLSMINDTVQHKMLSARESRPQEMHLMPLALQDRKEMVEAMFWQYNQRLTVEQMGLLMCKRASENPLWLAIACQELRVIQSSRQLHHAIQLLPDALLDLLEYVLERLESENGELLVATVCLLEASCSGLLEQELRVLLGQSHVRESMELDDFEEKDEKECSEKEQKKKRQSSPIAEDRWLTIFRSLRPYLRPYGDSREGRLDFYHRAFSKAVRRKYFRHGIENENPDESRAIYNFWHQQLANYFETCDNMDRKVEEYVYHLCRLEDSSRLAVCLSDWDVFDRLYSDEYSTQLLSFWRKAGGSYEMAECYQAALAELEATEPRDDNLVARRHEHVARILLQAGKYNESLELAKTAMKWEEKELGNRPERMVDLNSLMAEIYDEKLKLNDFVSRDQLPDLRKTISYGRKSIDLRKSFEGDYHKFKLGMSLMKLAFSLESWHACGGLDSEMTEQEALRKGNVHIDKAIKIFHELKDLGHYAEALMTKGVLAARGSNEQLKYYHEAMEICCQVYGEESLLSSRLFINIGIVHEDNGDYVKAFEYFKKWGETSEIVLGPDHPKTLRAKGVLREPKYRLVAERLKEQMELGNNGEIDKQQINDEVMDMDNDVEGLSDDEDMIHIDMYENDEERRDGGSDDGVENNLAEAQEMMQRIVSEIMQRMSSGQPTPQTDNRQSEAPTARRLQLSRYRENRAHVTTHGSSGSRPAIAASTPSSGGQTQSSSQSRSNTSTTGGNSETCSQAADDISNMLAQMAQSIQILEQSSMLSSSTSAPRRERRGREQGATNSEQNPPAPTPAPAPAPTSSESIDNNRSDNRLSDNDSTQEGGNVNNSDNNSDNNLDRQNSDNNPERPNSSGNRHCDRMHNS